MIQASTLYSCRAETRCHNGQPLSSSSSKKRLPLPSDRSIPYITIQYTIIPYRKTHSRRICLPSFSFSFFLFFFILREIKYNTSSSLPTRFCFSSFFFPCYPYFTSAPSFGSVFVFYIVVFSSIQSILFFFTPKKTLIRSIVGLLCQFLQFTVLLLLSHWLDL